MFLLLFSGLLTRLSRILTLVLFNIVWHVILLMSIAPGERDG